MKFLCAHDQIQMRYRGEERVATSLRHATKKTEDRLRTKFCDLTQHSHFAKRLLLGHVADAAGIEQDDVSIGFAGGALITAFEQRMRDLFRIALVHLAAVGFDEKFRHRESGL